MAKTEIKASEHKVFPEMIWATNGQVSLVEGQGDLFKIDAIPSNQIIEPLKYAVESVASINSQFSIDGKDISTEMPDDALGGITIASDLSPHPAHEIGFAFKQFRYKINNGSGSTSSDHRARLQYIVDARTTARRIVNLINNLGSFKIVPNEDPTPIAEEIRSQNKEVLGKRDIQAIQILWQERKINVLERILNGNKVPPKFSDWLVIHEVIGTEQQAIKKTLTSVFNASPLIDFDVPEGRVAVLEGWSGDVGSQSLVGEGTLSISRDNDKNFIELDYNCMGTSQKHYDWHIHAFDNLTIELKTTGTATNYKTWCGITIRNPGAAFKAKMEEFSPGVLPSKLEPTEAEERIIESLRLRELARTGIIAIG